MSRHECECLVALGQESRQGSDDSWSLASFPMPSEASPPSPPSPVQPQPGTRPGASATAGSSIASSPASSGGTGSGSVPAHSPHADDGAKDDSVAAKVKDRLGTFSKMLANSDTVKSLTTDTMKGLRSMGKFLSSKAATLSHVLAGKMVLPSDAALINLTALQVGFERVLEERGVVGQGLAWRVGVVVVVRFMS